MTPTESAAYFPQPPYEIGRNFEKPLLLGQGNLSVFIFDIYDAELWVERKPWGFDQKFALSIQYNRSITQKEFVDSSLEELQRYYDITTQEAAYRQTLKAILPSVEEGDRITAIFTPGKGLTFYHNATPLGAIQDLDFAQKYIMIWLHPKAHYDDLRRDLLGLRE